MKVFRALIVLPAAAIAATAVWGGHELPVYPSFYPDRIDIRSLAPGQAADALRTAEIHAYIGGPPPFDGAPPKPVRVIESLGQLVLIRVNLASPLAKDDASACGLITTAIGELAKRGQGFVLHPYPVTPFHGDYLYHADLAEAAKARFLAQGNASPQAPADQIKIKVSEELAALYPGLGQTTDWDVEVAGIDLAQLMERAALAVNGFEGPPWLKQGWFQAERILSGAVTEAALRQRIDGERGRLTAGDFGTLAERINLERDLVRSLTSQCRVAVAGYTLKREFVNDDYSAGIENIGFDSVTGLHSPIFLRTVKLKDFPWNGSLALGLGSGPQAAWNPVAGMTDPFGQLLWFAIGDPALFPAPNDSGWMLNRIADVEAGTRR